MVSSLGLERKKKKGQIYSLSGDSKNMSFQFKESFKCGNFWYKLKEFSLFKKNLHLSLFGYLANSLVFVLRMFTNRNFSHTSVNLNIQTNIQT